LGDSGLNWTGIIFYLVIGIVIFLVVAYIFDFMHFKAAVTQAFSSINLPKLDINGIFDWIKNNTVAFGVIMSIGTALVGAGIKYLQVNSTLNKTVDELAETKNIAANAKAQATALGEKISLYETDTTASELQKSLDLYKTEASNALAVKTSAYDEAQRTIARLQEQLDARPIIKYTEVK
jgi:hypothetical protein